MTQILHVTECYAGGVSRAIETAVRLTPEYEHHLIWAGAETPPDASSFESVEQLEAGFVPRVRHVRRTVERISPMVVHAHSSWAGVYTRLLRHTTPVIYQPHCYKFDDPSAPALMRATYRLAEKALSRRSVATAVLCEHERRLARSLNRHVPQLLVPNAPSIENHGTVRESAPPAHVVMIGRISRQKDPKFFADVARKGRRAGLPVEFTWVGDGEDKYKTELRGAGVTITGWLGEAELREVLLRPSIYLHSARYEGFPLSVLDAAAFGLPILARKIDAFEGTTLQQFVTADEAVASLAAVLSAPIMRETAIRGGADLMQVMNLDRQAGALRSMYEGFGMKAVIA